MSVLLGPFDKSENSASSRVDDNELLVFGYQCRLYRDDEKAELENGGELLIPWMGDRNLMVDRLVNYFLQTCSLNVHARPQSSVLRFFCYFVYLFTILL